MKVKNYMVRYVKVQIDLARKDIRGIKNVIKAMENSIKEISRMTDPEILAMINSDDALKEAYKQLSEQVEAKEIEDGEEGKETSV